MSDNNVEAKKYATWIIISSALVYVLLPNVFSVIATIIALVLLLAVMWATFHIAGLIAGFLAISVINAFNIIFYGNSENIDKTESDSGESSQHVSEVINNTITTFEIIFMLLGKVAKSDGSVSPEELRIVDDMINEVVAIFAPALSDSEKYKYKRKYRNIFNEAKKTPMGYQEIAKDYYLLKKGEKDHLCRMMGLLMKIACADNKYHDEERAMIENIAKIFQLSKNELREIELHFELIKKENSLSAAYKIIDVSPDASDEDIKRKRNELVIMYHPDKLEHMQLAKDIADYSRRRFELVQKAYKVIMFHRGRSQS